MAENGKRRILAVYDLLLRRTDERHYLTEREMAGELEKQGFRVERKTVYDDVAALDECGVSVEHKRGKGGGYCLVKRPFETAELKLLIDAVQASKFITAKRSEALIQKLLAFSSDYERRSLDREVYVENRLKSENNDMLYTVDTLHAALSDNRRVRFVYHEWIVEGKLAPRHGGADYEVSPYLLVWDDENYYLIAYHAPTDSLRHYRVDKMKNTRLTDLPREGEEVFGRLDPALYARSTFGMYGGREEVVRLRCDVSLAGVIIDRFGLDLPRRPSADGRTFEISPRVRVSPVFLAWLIGFGDKMRVLSPASVRQEALDLLSRAGTVLRDPDAPPAVT
ncbi:MAG: WYL domain-containing protein [Clostridia bacterium]|nr:WYL domain-containing protein [Clostridia bacterium]